MNEGTGSEDEDGETYSMVSSCSSRGRKRKRFCNSGDSKFDIKRLSNALATVTKSSQKAINQFSLRDDWTAVAQMYYNKTRIGKNEKKRLYNHYNRHMTDFTVTSPRNSVENASASELTSLPIVNDFTKKERRWLCAVGEVVKNGAAGLVEAAMKQATNQLLMKRPSPLTQNVTRHRDKHSASFSSKRVIDAESLFDEIQYGENSRGLDEYDQRDLGDIEDYSGEVETDGEEKNGLFSKNADEEKDESFCDNVQKDELFCEDETHLEKDEHLSEDETHNVAKDGHLGENKGEKRRNSDKKEVDNGQNSGVCKSNRNDDTVKGLFEEIGISHDTAEAMAGCSLPKTKVVKKKIHGMVYKLKVPAEWRALPILQHNGYRSYGGDYINVCLACVKKYNPFCSFIMKGNFIKKEDSRKCNSAFFNGKGQCHPPCPCKFTITLQSQHDSHLSLKFTGDVRHDITKPVFRQIRGKEREQEKNKYLKNTKLNPAEEYRKKLDSVSPTSFANGNRDGAGASKKTHQNIKAEAIRDINSFDVLHKRLLDTQKKHFDIDNKNALKQGPSALSRKIFGYIQTFIVTHDELKIIIFHEKEIRLFHDLCSKDIVYLDSSGGMLRKLAKFDTVYLYAVGIRHPFGETFPLPTGMYISSSHTTEAVRYFLMILRENERKIYKEVAMPRIIITDNSNVLQNACLAEFNGESRLAYQRRTYRIVNGSATDDDLKLSLLVSCHTHIIGQVKRAVSSYDGSKKHFCLRVIGRMINCSSLPELTLIVQKLHTVMTSKYVVGNVEEAVACLNDLINDWSSVINKLTDDECDNVDEEKDEEDVVAESSKSPWQLYWDDALGPTEAQTEEDYTDKANIVDGGINVESTDEAGNETYVNQKESDDSPDAISDSKDGQCKSRKSLNKYYMPKFFDYFRKNMLKDVDFWTKLCYADLSRYGPRYSDFLKEPNSCGRNYRIKNTSNACIENIFKFIKNDKSAIKTPLIPFIELLSQKVNTLAKEYIHCIITNLEKSKDCDFTNRNVKNFKKLQNEESNLSGSDQDDFPYSPEKEIWSDKKTRNKRKCDRSMYLAQPPKDIKLNPVKSCHSKNSKKEDDAMYNKFRAKVWKDVSEGHGSVKSVEKDIKSKWQNLNKDEKKNQTDTIACCETEDTSLDFISCLLCRNNYHPKCIQYDFELAFLNKYACKSCVVANFQGLINCLYYSLRYSFFDQSIQSAVEKFSKMPLHRAEALKNHTFLPESYAVGEIRIRSITGMVNAYNNCWLSSLVHCLFGTNIYNVLSSTIFEDTTSRLIRSLSGCITSSTNLFFDETLSSLRKLSEICKFDLHAKKCRDPCEAFENFVDAIKAEDRFSANMITISRCDECEDVYGGSKCIGASVELKVPGYLNSSPSIENILWNTFIARYLAPTDGGEWCPKCKKLVGASTYSFFTNCPIILSIKIDRTDVDTGRLNIGEITASKVLSLYTLCPSFSDTEHSTYTLLATINNEGGESIKTNHFTAYLFDHKSNDAVKFNDTSVKSLKADKLLSESYFKESIYMLFYMRNDSLTAASNCHGKVTSNFDIPIGRRIKVEDRIFNGRDEESFRIYHSVLGSNKLKGDAVSAFIAQQSEMSRLNVLSGSTNLLESVTNGRLTKEYHHFMSIDVYSYDMLVIPYHLNTKSGHFSLVVVYPNKKSIILLDSSDAASLDPFFSCLHLLRQCLKQPGNAFILDEWSCIKPNVPQQTDGTSCGVWCCLNGYKIMHETDVPCTDTDIPFVRYWIAEKILSYKTKKLSKNERTPGEVSLPLKGEIEVLTDLPIQSIGGSVYEKIFTFRKSISKVESKVPTRKSAQESRTKLALLIDSNQVEDDKKIGTRNKTKRRKTVKKEDTGNGACNNQTDDETNRRRKTVKKEDTDNGACNNQTDDETNRRRKTVKKEDTDNGACNNETDDETKRRRRKSLPKKCVRYKIEVKDEIEEEVEQSSEDGDDDYSQRLKHVGKCRTKTSELIPYRELDRNLYPVREDPMYLEKMTKYAMEHGTFPQDDGAIKLGIDRENGTAEVTDGNHRLTCAANYPSSTPEYVKVTYHFGRYTNRKKLRKGPEWGSQSFICGCDLGFTTTS